MTATDHVLSSAEKLARQRQAAAIARSQAHILQLKVVVVCGCAIAATFGIALHRAGSTGTAAPVQRVQQAKPQNVYQGPATRRIGEIQLPHQGDTCRHYRFDNTTGVVGDETLISCEPVNIAPKLSETSRTEAVMRAFRFSK